MPIIIALYILTGFSILGIEYKKLIHNKCITFGVFCFSFFAILCCIIPGLTLWTGDLSRCKNHSDNIAFISYLLTLMSYISAYYGYYLAHPKRNFKKLSKEVSISEKTILTTAIIFLIISGFSLVLYSSGYGGIVQTMLVGGQIRASFIQSSNAFAFFKHFIPMSMISSLLLYTDLYIKKNKKKKALKILTLIISFTISFIYIMANDGRMLAGIFILLFIIIKIKYQYEIDKVSIKKILISTIIICSLIFILIIQSENFFRIIRGNSIDDSSHNFLEIILSEFNFIYVGLYTSIDSISKGIVSFMFLNDILNGIFAWLPTSLKPIILEDVWDHNTILINDGGYGQSPTNIVAQAFYDMGIIGIMIIPFSYTFFIGRVEKIFCNNYSSVGIVFFTITAFYFAKGIAYFSIYNIMMNMFFIVFSWYIYKYGILKITSFRALRNRMR